MKKKYKFVVIVLVYRNCIDLIDCIDSIYEKVDDCKIVIVNAYYDEESKQKIQEIANTKNCDFLNEVNKGYSYGNNRGIEYVKKNYEFEYIIISNPDIVVEKRIANLPDAEIIAPKIIAASGKNQNPMMIREVKLADYFIYRGIKNNISLLYYSGIALKKIVNKFYMLFNKNSKYINIFAAHGSFVIIRKNVIECIQPLYDENMFLFAEEGVLAQKCREEGFCTIYDDGIEINHKEDGCMKLADFSINNELKKANIYYYENYVIDKTKKCKY